MNKIIMFMITTTFAVFRLTAASRAVDEQYNLVRQALMYDVSSASLDNMTQQVVVDVGVDRNTWAGFPCGPGSGWTIEEKQGAFLYFLNSMGTNNLATASDLDKTIASTAILKCRQLAYTNGIPALKAIVMNPSAIDREMAIGTVIQLGDVDAGMRDFVEQIITNTTSFSLLERGVACGMFAKKVYDQSASSSNEEMCRLATSMLYGNRSVDVAGAKMLDVLFCARYGGYINSSNRLEFAQFVLDHPNCRSYNRRDFTSITNQLLSSGHPLQWINVGGNNP